MDGTGPGNTNAAAIVARLDQEYRRSVGALREALTTFLAAGLPPDPETRAGGAFVSPELRLTWPPGLPFPRIGRAFARMAAPGRYATTVTRPDLFGDYLTEQLSLLQQDFGVELEVGRSRQEIPYPYVLDGASMDLADVSASSIARHFPTTELAHIGDEVADGAFVSNREGLRPLALFDGLRTDFSL